MEKYRPSVFPIAAIYLLSCAITLVFLLLFFLPHASKLGKSQMSSLLLIRHIFSRCFHVFFSQSNCEYIVYSHKYSHHSLLCNQNQNQILSNSLTFPCVSINLVYTHKILFEICPSFFLRQCPNLHITFVLQWIFPGRFQSCTICTQEEFSGSEKRVSSRSLPSNEKEKKQTSK